EAIEIGEKAFENSRVCVILLLRVGTGFGNLRLKLSLLQVPALTWPSSSPARAEHDRFSDASDRPDGPRAGGRADAGAAGGAASRPASGSEAGTGDAQAA